MTYFMVTTPKDPVSPAAPLYTKFTDALWAAEHIHAFTGGSTFVLKVQHMYTVIPATAGVRPGGTGECTK